MPEGWCWCKLEDIVYITNGSTLDKSEELTSGEIPYIKVGDMNMPGNEIEILSSNAYLNDVKTVISIPSIIFPKRGGAILTNKKRKVINQPIWIDLNIMAVTAIDNNTFDYIWTWFSQLDLSTLCNGGNIPQINTPDIANLLFPLPPIKEQKQIVFEVAKWLALVASLDESKQSVGTIIKMTKSKILVLAIHGKLVPQDPNDEPASELLKRINPKAVISCDNPHYIHEYQIPSNWTWTTLGAIGKWQSGGTPSRMHKEYYGGHIPWLKTGDLNDGIITEIPERITELGLENSSAKLNPVGSILIAMYGATIGKVGILGIPATTNQACCACVDYNGIIQKYLFYFLLSHKEEFIALGGGGAQPNISKEIITKTPIPIPPMEEQLRIVEKIEKLYSQLDMIKESLQA